MIVSPPAVRGKDSYENLRKTDRSLFRAWAISPADVVRGRFEAGKCDDPPENSQFYSHDSFKCLK